jgi:hypothetical protein
MGAPPMAFARIVFAGRKREGPGNGCPALWLRVRRAYSMSVRLCSCM